MAAVQRSTAAVVVSLLCLVAVLLVGGSLVLAAFTARTTSSGSFAAASDFDTGSLSTWGGTHLQPLPLQVGTDTGWTQTSTGRGGDCAVRSPGTLWCYGYNGYGQLGLGDTSTRTTLTQVGTASTWTSVGEGLNHTCGLRSDGTMWCWGANESGQLGVGSTVSQSSPVQVTSPSSTGWAQLSVGYNGACAVRTDTSLYCWGANGAGQVGDSTTTTRTAPVAVTSPASTGWTSPSSGGAFACGLRTDGLVYCWGTNGRGQLGRGNVVSSSTPVQVTGTGFATLSSGYYHTCSVKTDGSLWCWGNNYDGELGIGYYSAYSSSPIQSGSATTWARVSAGYLHNCATMTDGTLWCWGLNTSGQVGVGMTATNFLNPTQITLPATTGWALTTLSVFTNRTCAVRTGGGLWCWGSGYGVASTPTLLDATTTWHKPTVGLDFTCALRTTGALYCWGVNGNGQLGDGTTTSRTSPTLIGASTSWTSVSAGQSSTCGLRSDTTLWCWGLNTNGQLGIGSTTQQTSPTQVTTPSATGWSTVSVGSTSTCADRTDGTLYCWGLNDNGQLGNDTLTQATSPTAVTNVTGAAWTSVSVGAGSVCGLQTAALYCWGTNAKGQLGIGTTVTQKTPTAAAGTWRAVALGSAHACGVRTDATLWCWGSNSSGQLGNAGTSDSSIPVQAGTATTWQTVSAGVAYTCGTRTGRTVWCWGENQYGQLGFSDSAARSSPEQLPATTGRLVQAGSSGYSTMLLQPTW